MSDNPNNMIKYCSDCVYFKRRWNDFWSVSKAICTKISYDSNPGQVLHPKYNKTYYMDATYVRKNNCISKYWEPKG